jgi:histidine ammonia-lyase
MTGAIVLDGAALTPDAVVSVAREGTSVELAPAARERNAQAREASRCTARPPAWARCATG